MCPSIETAEETWGKKRLRLLLLPQSRPLKKRKGIGPPDRETYENGKPTPKSAASLREPAGKLQTGGFRKASGKTLIKIRRRHSQSTEAFQ
jgi:hypothetical protein